MENKGNRTKHKEIIVLLVVVVLVIAGTIAVYIHNQNAVFHYEDSLEKTAVFFDGGEIKLRELSYYFMIEEEAVNETALIYNPEKPLEYWGLYIDNKFVSDEARNTAVNFCIRDVLYSQYAKEEGMSLSDEELLELENNANQMFRDLTEKQAKLKLTKEDICVAMQRNELADKFVIKSASDNELSMTEEVLSAYYGLNSKFFKEAKIKRNVKVDEELLDNVRMGTLTIN